MLESTIAVVQKTIANPVDDEYRNVVRLANEIKGNRFDEISLDDVQELVEDY